MRALLIAALLLSGCVQFSAGYLEGNIGVTRTSNARLCELAYGDAISIYPEHGSSEAYRRVARNRHLECAEARCTKA